MKIPVLIACLLMLSCSNLAYEGQAGSAPARTSAAPAQRGATPSSYVVRSGDTLYSIAFRYGLDQRELAAWNGISNPNRIRVGQALALTPPAAANRVASSSSAATAPPSRASAGTPPRPASAGTSTTAAGTSPARSAPAARPVTTAGPSAWTWPARGRLVTRFGDRGVLSTGIGIAGQLGQDVVASASGRVVYAGSGLPDYGQLLIIEHDETWLSAYGHNRRLLVGQGDTVTRGQKIAEMGPGPGGEPRLHFEIRRNGDPLDPLGLLPASG